MGDGVISTQELYHHELDIDEQNQEKDRWVSLGIHPHNRKLASFKDALSARAQEKFDNDKDAGFWDWRR